MLPNVDRRQSTDRTWLPWKVVICSLSMLSLLHFDRARSLSVLSTRLSALNRQTPFTSRCSTCAKVEADISSVRYALPSIKCPA